METTYVLHFYPITSLSLGNDSLFLEVSFPHNEHSHLPVFQNAVSTLLRLLHEQENKDTQNCNNFICLGIEKMYWEMQSKIPFHSFDVNLCATLHEFSHDWEIHS